jgi:hypothetical protein
LTTHGIENIFLNGEWLLLCYYIIIIHSSRQKAARSQPTPYKRPKTSPQPTPAITTPPATLRECYNQRNQRFHPNILPRHDFDIVALACFKGRDSGFYDYSDMCIELQYRRFTAEQVKDGSALSRIFLDATEKLNKVEVPTGVCISVCHCIS